VAAPQAQVATTVEHRFPAVLRHAAALALLLALAVGVAGCAAVGGIFKAGLWVGVIVAVLVVVVVLLLVRSMSR
jgi:hypothetical protein